MNVAVFDLDDIMREVRAVADLAIPAKVANQLKRAPEVSRLAELAAPSAAGLRARILEIQSAECPRDFLQERWFVVRAGVARFADEWADKAMALGWTLDDLFALAEPFANVSLQGAAWFVGDKTVTAVTADAITLRTESGATQRVYRKVSA